MDDELKSRLQRAVAPAPPGSAERLLAGARPRAVRPTRRSAPAIFAVAIAVIAVALGAGGLAYTLRSGRSTGPIAARGIVASPSASPTAPAPAETPTPAPSTAPTVSPGAPLVVLPTTASVIPAGQRTVWATVAGTPGTLLFRSTDQGTTWVQRTLPNTLNTTTPTFVDDMNGWLVDPGGTATACTYQGFKVWVTHDGAMTWQTLGAAGIPLDQCKGTLAFVDARIGFLTTHCSVCRPVIYRTSDGGASWSASRPLPDPPGQPTDGSGEVRQLGPVADFGSELLIQASVGQQQPVYVYHSLDGGATWSELRTITQGSDPTVTFVDRNHWWVSGAGLGPAYLYTSDAGAHFGAAPGAPSSAAPVALTFTFGSQAVGYATVRGQIWRTQDGGVHWTPLRTPGT